ncbi:MAG: recombinase family protein [Ktedonobacterales bacterium]|nr:recombinase family protein [Ktedonobacterales bacterium]
MERKRKYDRLYQPLTEPPAGTRFVGYARYSSDMQDKVTIVTQHRKMAEFAAAHHWEIIDWVDEPATSAKYDDVHRRPRFAEMLAAAGSDFTGILCYDSSRWSRNNAVTYTTLDDLRHRGIWWATADGLWNSNRLVEDGHSIAFAVDTGMNANFLMKHSKRMIDSKEERALGGLHQSQPPYGYLPPDYPPLPPGIGVNRKAPPIPVRPDPATWPALQLIAELRCARRSCKEIADALNLAGYRTRGNRWNGKHEAHLGEEPFARRFTEDTIWNMLHNAFYCEFEPGCQHGTIITPAGVRLMGRHEAAWPYATWQRMLEVAAELRYAPQASETKRAIYPFGGIIICATCRLPMRSSHTDKPEHILRYHRCAAKQRGLSCTASATTPAWRVEKAFGYLLQRYRLGDNWQDDLVQLAEASATQADQSAAQLQQLHEEQETFNMMLLAKGIDASRYQREMARINSARQAILRQQEVQQHGTEVVLQAGEQMTRLPELWELARAHEALDHLREMVLALLQPNGLAWDGTQRMITGLCPYPEYVPSIRLALADWAWEGHWLTCPSPESEKSPQPRRRVIRDPRTKTTIRRESAPTRYALTAEQQREALRMLEAGQSMREVGHHFQVSHGAIWRLAHRQREEE